ncbi:histidine kinase [Sinanaerobacter sp. ZZT-01]|uniref:histidine kinase n=1 Tax=Sinanaerobacter sp. ZZT-01 TaxID=3111540 RepID=UPI002D76EFF5|nr:histidine kinase [Sinanaerobacter sp. ZZT-01]WRR93748.1 histidine kinase [Sinanaerobacter sp. ZZT-01]
MNNSKKTEKSLIFTGVGLLTLLVSFGIIYTLNIPPKEERALPDQMMISYYEDTVGRLTVYDASAKWDQGGFVRNETPSFSFGRSHSTFWIRIEAKKRRLLKNYIALFCPNIQDVQLYIPTEDGYDVHYSGWANSLTRDDERMTYPVFQLNTDTLREKPIYMRIQSDYSHNYTLEFYTQKELNQARIVEFSLNSFLFGMLVAVAFTNLIAFFKIKDKNLLAFSICILLLSIHQGISYGMYNIIIPSHSYIIMRLSIEIGLLFILSIIVFFIIFSGVKVYNKFYYKTLLFFIAACLMGYPICFMDKVAANFYGHSLTIIIPLFILYVSFRMHRSGHKEQRLFMIGWGLTILLYAISMLVCEGIIQMGISTFHLPTELIIMLTVSMVFAVAITEYVRWMQLDGQQVRQQYQEASERIKWTETALLQTQIKPHFLYNTLTAIEQLCETDSEKAQRAIVDFAAFLRSNIDFSTETQLIRIERELSNVKHYLSLEQMRFEERLKVEYDIQADGFLVPPLVVQPMVENAVRHGITKRAEGGTITISIRDGQTDYIIQVTDDGVGFDLNSDIWIEGYHIGIDNARERLHRQCGGGFCIDSKIDVGTVVTMSIPKGVNL